MKLTNGQIDVLHTMIEKEQALMDRVDQLVDRHTAGVQKAKCQEKIEFLEFVYDHAHVYQDDTSVGI